jgi:hypothetical protein
MATTTTFTWIGRGFAADPVAMAASIRRDVKTLARIIFDCDSTRERGETGNREWETGNGD